jgi:biopolymer transport protein ExbB
MIGGAGVFDLVRQGGIVMAPLALCSIVSVAVIAERLWALSSAARRSERFHRAALEAWQEGGVSEVVAVTRRDDSLLGMVYRGVLSLADADDDTRLQVATRQVSTATRSLKRYVWLLGTIGNESADLRERTDDLLLRLRTSERTAAPRTYGSAAAH